MITENIRLLSSTRIHFLKEGDNIAILVTVIEFGVENKISLKFFKK